jgi:hypothetical protein
MRAISGFTHSDNLPVELPFVSTGYTSIRDPDPLQDQFPGVSIPSYFFQAPHTFSSDNFQRRPTMSFLVFQQTIFLNTFFTILSSVPVEWSLEFGFEQRSVFLQQIT